MAVIDTRRQSRRTRSLRYAKSESDRSDCDRDARPRRSFKHLLMGSVAERVVRTAPCPVLTVHAHERDFIVPDAISLEMSA